MKTGLKILLAGAISAGGILLLRAFTRAAPLPAPPAGKATLQISTAKAGLTIAVPIAVDGQVVGNDAVTVLVEPGSYVVSWANVSFTTHTTPAPQTVVLTAGQSRNVTGTFVRISTPAPQGTIEYFGIQAQMTPGHSYSNVINLKNPFSFSQQFTIYVYTSRPSGDPTPGSPSDGAPGSIDTLQFSVAAGGPWSYAYSITAPNQVGTFHIWLRLYVDNTFIRLVDSGKDITVANPPPPAPLPVNLQQQIAPIANLVVKIWDRAPGGEWNIWTPDPSDPANWPGPILVGDKVNIEVSTFASLTVRNTTYNAILVGAVGGIGGKWWINIDSWPA